MRNLWEKIKNVLSIIWNGLTTIGRIILGLILIGIIVAISFAFSKDSSEESAENTPEIAQVYEPSIGTPIPPDVNQEGSNSAPSDSGTVSGATTTEPAQNQNNQVFVAPASGIDDKEPIKYLNDSLRFSATLPPYSKVLEQPDNVRFTAGNGTLIYVVSTTPVRTENLSSIEAQLRNSTTASAISRTSFKGMEAIQFDANGYGMGIALIAHGNIYYLLGNMLYFPDFKIL